MDTQQGAGGKPGNFPESRKGKGQGGRGYGHGGRGQSYDSSSWEWDEPRWNGRGSGWPSKRQQRNMDRKTWFESTQHGPQCQAGVQVGQWNQNFYQKGGKGKGGKPVAPKPIPMPERPPLPEYMNNTWSVCRKTSHGTLYWRPAETDDEISEAQDEWGEITRIETNIDPFEEAYKQKAASQKALRAEKARADSMSAQDVAALGAKNLTSMGGFGTGGALAGVPVPKRAEPSAKPIDVDANEQTADQEAVAAIAAKDLAPRRPPRVRKQQTLEQKLAAKKRQEAKVGTVAWCVLNIKVLETRVKQLQKELDILKGKKRHRIPEEASDDGESPSSHLGSADEDDLDHKSRKRRRAAEDDSESEEEAMDEGTADAPTAEPAATEPAATEVA